MIKRQGINWKDEPSPDYCEQPLLLNPEDSYMVKYDEYTQDRPSYVAWFTPGAGPGMEGEMSDTCYGAGDEIPYHEHNQGYEVFLVDEGRAEVTTRGLRCIADKGDIVFVPPFVSHGFKYLDEPTVWREWFQGLRMNEGLLEQRRFRQYGDASISAAHFDQKIARRLGTDWFAFKPVVRDVPKESVWNIRTYGFAYEVFEFPGVRMLQKVARHEVDGNIEFWQYRMDKGFTVTANMWNAHGIRWAVFAGSLEVKIPNHEGFTARTHDIINIPSYMPCEITAAEDGTVVFDFSCKGRLFRALEHIRAMKREGDEILKDEKKLALLLEEKYDLFTLGGLRK